MGARGESADQQQRHGAQRYYPGGGAHAYRHRQTARQDRVSHRGAAGRHFQHRRLRPGTAGRHGGRLLSACDISLCARNRVRSGDAWRLPPAAAGAHQLRRALPPASRTNETGPRRRRQHALIRQHGRARSALDETDPRSDSGRHSGMSAAPIAVLGAGSWGTALALLLAGNGRPAVLWSRAADHAAAMVATRRNPRYLADVPFPATLRPTAELAEAAALTDLLVAVPAAGVRDLLVNLKPRLRPGARLAWASKGLETGTGRLLHEVAAEILGPGHALAVVSGPTFAREVALGLPTAVTVASADRGFAADLAARLHGPCFRAYTSADVTGVELGGAVRNVSAIAAGIADGLGFGANSRAALVTRGLAEMMRLGVAMGGHRDTFMGLAGLGDLVLPCTDDQSRNRRIGVALARGQTLAEACAAVQQVAEGVHAACEVQRLAARLQVEMPITEQVCQVLYHHKSPREAVQTLLLSEQKAERVRAPGCSKEGDDSGRGPRGTHAASHGYHAQAPAQGRRSDLDRASPPGIGAGRLPRSGCQHRSSRCADRGRARRRRSLRRAHHLLPRGRGDLGHRRRHQQCPTAARISDQSGRERRCVYRLRFRTPARRSGRARPSGAGAQSAAASAGRFRLAGRRRPVHLQWHRRVPAAAVRRLSAGSVSAGAAAAAGDGGGPGERRII